MIEKTFKKGKKGQWRLLIHWFGFKPKYTYTNRHGNRMSAYSKIFNCWFLSFHWDYNHADRWTLEELFEKVFSRFNDDSF